MCMIIIGMILSLLPNMVSDSFYFSLVIKFSISWMVNGLYVDHPHKPEKHRADLHLRGGQAGADDWPLRGGLGQWDNKRVVH